MATESISGNDLVEITADVDFVNMGDGSYVLELTITYPLLVRARGKAGGMIFLAGQIFFTPMPADDAERMRDLLEAMPGYPAAARMPAPAFDYNDVLDLVDEEIPF